MDRDVVEMCGQGGQFKVECANLRPSSCRLVRLLHNLAYRELLEIAAAEIDISAHRREQNQNHAARQGPTNCPFPLHDVSLESLSDCDVVLRRIDPGYRVQIASEVNPHWTDRCGVAQSHAYRIAVVVDEIVEVDSAVN